MKRRHTRGYYLKWLFKNNKTIFDLISAIHRNCGVALEHREVIDYLIYNQFTAHDLAYIFKVV